MNRSQFLNRLIEEKGYKKYLEIGINNPNGCFNHINATRTGVDPYGEVYEAHNWTEETKDDFIGAIDGEFFRMTSDEFFEGLDKRKKFDLIFIDGLHLEEQVLKDIENALKHLKKGGAIVLHDCLPSREDQATPEPHGGEWCGTVWRAFATLRQTREDLKMHCVNTDFGLGVIQAGTQEKYIDHQFGENVGLSWPYYQSRKNKLMNVVSVEEYFNE